MKKLLIIIIVVGLVLTLSFVGCKAAVSEETTAAAETTAASNELEITKHFQIAWLPPDMFNPFWTYQRQGMEKVAFEVFSEKGYRIDISLLAPIKVFEVAEQVAIFENAIQMAPDGIVVCPTDQNSLVPVVIKAWEAGIPTVGVGGPIIPAKELLADFEIDNFATTAMLGKYTADFLNKDAKAVILSGITGNTLSDWREGGYKKACEDAGIEVLDTQPANFNRAGGLTLMENYMARFPQIDVAFCANDEVALGAYEAIVNAGRQDEIKVVGLDGNRDTIQSIIDGGIFCTANQDPWLQGELALKQLIEYWEGKSKEDIEQKQWFMGTLIDSKNAPNEIGKFAEWEKWYKE